MSKLFTVFLVLCALLMVASACHRRPLEDPSDSVSIQVEVNVRAVANVTTSVYNQFIPVPDLNTDMMRVLVYNPDTKALITQSFISSKTHDEQGNAVLSGNLNISFGTFDILIYNFDTPTVHVNGENNENSILAYTEELPADQRLNYHFPVKADNDGDALSEDDYVFNYEPDHFLVAHEKALRVSPHDSVVVIKTTAQTIIDTYYIQVHVTGIEYASHASAVITGLSPSNHFGIGERTSSPVAAVGFDLRKSTDITIPGENKDVLCALFNTFGKIPDVNSDLYVTFSVIDTSGSLQQMSCSLNQVFLTEDAIERHWLLVDEVFEIHKPDDPITPTQNGGFQPMVNDWEEEHSEINI